MDFGSFLAAGAQLFGSAASNVANFFSSAISSKKAYKYAQKLAAQQFDYNKQMMMHRHQWEVDDLRSAGLNPILSAGGGGAAGSTGSGGSVNVHTPQVGFAGDIQSAISLADQLKNTKKQRELQDIENAISAERLKQERMKTDYISKDPLYYSRHLGYGAVVTAPSFLRKYLPKFSDYLESDVAQHYSVPTTFHTAPSSAGSVSRSRSRLFKGDDGMWFRHDMKPLTPRDREMIRKLERR